MSFNRAGCCCPKEIFLSSYDRDFVFGSTDGFRKFIDDGAGMALDASAFAVRYCSIMLDSDYVYTSSVVGSNSNSTLTKRNRSDIAQVWLQSLSDFAFGSNGTSVFPRNNSVWVTGISKATGLLRVERRLKSTGAVEWSYEHASYKSPVFEDGHCIWVDEDETAWIPALEDLGFPDDSHIVEVDADGTEISSFFVFSGTTNVQSITAIWKLANTYDAGGNRTAEGDILVSCDDFAYGRFTPSGTEVWFVAATSAITSTLDLAVNESIGEMYVGGANGIGLGFKNTIRAVDLSDGSTIRAIFVAPSNTAYEFDRIRCCGTDLYITPNSTTGANPPGEIQRYTRLDTEVWREGGAGITKPIRHMASFVRGS